MLKRFLKIFYGRNHRVALKSIFLFFLAIQISWQTFTNGPQILIWGQVKIRRYIYPYKLIRKFLFPIISWSPTLTTIGRNQACSQGISTTILESTTAITFSPTATILVHYTEELRQPIKSNQYGKMYLFSRVLAGKAKPTHRSDKLSHLKILINLTLCLI